MLGTAMETHRNLVSEVVTPWPSQESLGSEYDMLRAE